jgi:hypothetical protein
LAYRNVPIVGDKVQETRIAFFLLAKRASRKCVIAFATKVVRSQGFIFVNLSWFKAEPSLNENRIFQGNSELISAKTLTVSDLILNGQSQLWPFGTFRILEVPF